MKYYVNLQIFIIKVHQYNFCKYFNPLSASVEYPPNGKFFYPSRIPIYPYKIPAGT